MISRFTTAAKQLKREVLTLYCATRDPRTPWLARVLAVLIVAYALSPIDLIPDFIPVLGQLDDLILVPLGVWFVLRFIPRAVLEDARLEAARLERKPISVGGLVFMIVIWALAALWLARVLNII
jgi:uncharacterized membrane protein YkvA (DUF1232 family)